MKSLLRTLSLNHEKRLFSYFVADVFIDNGLLGTQFIFHVDDCQTLKLPKIFPFVKRLPDCLERHNGLLIRPLLDIENNTVPYGVPDDYVSLIQRSPNFVNHLISPLLGTVLFGQYKGLQFSLFGTKEISDYFSLPAVQRAVRGTRGFHRACKFERVTHREAIAHYGKLTFEVYVDLLKHKTLKKH